MTTALKPVKLTVAWVGQWGSYQGMDGEDRNVCYAVGASLGSTSQADDQQPPLRRIRIYDISKKQYFAVNSTIKLLNCRLENTEVIVNEYTRVYRCPLVPVTKSQLQEAADVGMAPPACLGNLVINKEVTVEGTISSIQALREVNVKGHGQAKVRNLVLTEGNDSVEVALWRLAAEVSDAIISCGHRIKILHAKVGLSKSKKPVINVNCPEWVQLAVIDIEPKYYQHAILDGIGGIQEDTVALSIAVPEGDIEVKCSTVKLEQLIEYDGNGVSIVDELVNRLPLDIEVTIDDGCIVNISLNKQ